MLKNREKSLNLMIIVSILVAITVVVSVLFWREMKILNNAYSDMNQIEFLSSSTQRLISIAQSETFLQKDVFFIGESTTKALTPGSDDALSVLVDPEMVVLSNEVMNSWTQIELILSKENINKIDLSLSRDAHFKSMTNLSSAISNYSKELNSSITRYQMIVIGLFFSIAMVMLNNLLRTHAEIRQSDELAKTAQIDTATGLYNRSRCQELFRNNQQPANRKHPAILVIDLNDLKKTNDSLGHRVGDELIASFASILKSAANVHIIQPFIGRYGGDEFVIYYDDVGSEDDIKSFLKELSFLNKNFNDENTKFKISYAIGYSYISTSNDERLTMRQLFDLADEAMYENKVSTKLAQNPNYVAQNR